MPIYAIGDDEPQIDPDAWVHPQAVVMGKVTVAAEATIWGCAVLRGDFGAIEVGPRTSVQDGTVVHAGLDIPTVIGRECIIGHNAYVEGCRIEDEVLVGSMSSVLPLAVLGRGCVIAAGAVVTRETKVPPRALAVGVPAEIEENAIEEGRWEAGVKRYVELGARNKLELRRLD